MLVDAARLWKTHLFVDEDHKILWITFPTSTTGNTNNRKYGVVTPGRGPS